MSHLLSNNFQKIIDEQRERKERKKKKKKMKTITVKKFNPDTKTEEWTKIETPDSDTFNEIFKRYGNDYRYFCAMFPLETHPELRLNGGRWRPFELFPDKEKAKEELEKNPRDYPYGGIAPAIEYILEQNPHLNPLKLFGEHIAWIDVDRNCILVEDAPKSLYSSTA